MGNYLQLCRQLQLLPEVNTVQKSIPNQYPKLFTGQGAKGSLRIRMKSDAKPYVLLTPRHVLGLKYKQNSKGWNPGCHLQGIDIYTLVCRNGDGNKVNWRCTHLYWWPLTKNYLWEIYSILKVETALVQLSGVRVFSKLDANSGFWQILDLESRLLITFLIPFGRYWFKTKNLKNLK